MTATPYERLHEAVNTRDMAVIEQCVEDVVAPDAVFHAPEPVNARLAVNRAWSVLLEAFPDMHVTVDDMITEGDRTVYRNTCTGTHLGQYRGMAPTGKTVEYREIFIVRSADGRITDVWGVVDIYTQLLQLDAIQPHAL